MMSRIRSMFGSFTEQKYWHVGDHKVFAYEVKVLGTETYGDIREHTARQRTKYECEHCEKTFDSRENFKHEECYEVTYE